MIVEYPLTKSHRLRLARVFAESPRVDLSIDCVIEGQMGKVYVDQIPNPSAYKIQVGPFAYLAGDPSSAGGQELLKSIQPWMLLMPSPAPWVEACKQFYGERLISFERYSFSSECLSKERLEKLTIDSRFRNDITRMDVSFATQVWGQDHFVDLSDFDSPFDFVERGIGYFVSKGGHIVGAAYASLVCSKGIEVSLFVPEEHRRQGMGISLSAQLIKWCRENNIDAHWDAANLESCALAERLGYIPTGKYQAYYLKP